MRGPIWADEKLGVMMLVMKKLIDRRLQGNVPPDGMLNLMRALEVTRAVTSLAGVPCVER